MKNLKNDQNHDHAILTLINTNEILFYQERI